MLTLKTLLKLATTKHTVSLSNNFVLHTGDVHIWIVNQDQVVDYKSHFLQLLSQEEQERLLAFKCRDSYLRFVLRRGILRMLLALYTQQHPAEVVISVRKYGKPYLASGELHFNISHSDELAIMAFSENRLGIDIEKIQPIDDAVLVVNHQYSTCEQQYWSSLDEDERLSAFYKIWTGKEAFIKFIGTGLTMPLKSFDIVVNDETRYIRLPNKQTNDYHVYDVPVAHDYLATLITQYPSTIKLNHIH